MKLARAGFFLWTLIALPVCHGGEGGGRIALTFDDGPDTELTPRLLDALKKSGARATFFPIGEKVPVHPDIIRRIAAEGHEIGNHGWGHLKMTRLSERSIRDEIRRTSRALADGAGVRAKFFRPPHGLVDRRLREIVVGEDGLSTVTWNLECGDWGAVTVGGVVNRILSGAKDGSIILMHDTNPRTVEAMERVVPELKKRGFALVGLSEIRKSAGGETEKQP